MKEKIRKQLLARRAGMDNKLVAGLSRAVLRNLTGLAAWKDAREALIYLPVNNEVDTWPLLRELWGRKARVLLPRCRPDVPGEMDLARASHPEHIVPGSFGIPEPDPDVCESVLDATPDLVLVPGVAFDPRGYRLGHGGGYFDRLFARKNMQKAIKIGLGFSFQVVDELPTDTWDRPVDAICTEEKVIWTK